MKLKPATVYYVFKALLHFGIGITVTGYVPYLLSIGISLGEVALVNFVFWAGVVIFELPTGMLADGRGRAWSLRVGILAQSFCATTYMLANGLPLAILAELFASLSVAMQSGTLQAWITDALERQGQSHVRRQVFATGAIVHGVCMLVGGVLGAGLAYLEYRLIWLPLVAIGIVGYMFGRRYMNGEGEPLERVSEYVALKNSMKLLRTSSDLRWVVGVFVVFGLVVCFNFYWAPYFKAEVGQLSLGWVWLIVYLPCVFGGWIVRRLTASQGQEGNYLVLSMVSSGLGMLLLVFTNSLFLSLSAVFIHEVGRGLFEPLNDSFVQHRVSSSIRATFGSVQSFLGRLGFALVPLSVWASLSDYPDTRGTIRLIWLVAGALLVCGALLLWLVRPRTSS